MRTEFPRLKCKQTCAEERPIRRRQRRRNGFEKFVKKAAALGFLRVYLVTRCSGRATPAIRYWVAPLTRADVRILICLRAGAGRNSLVPLGHGASLPSYRT